MEKQFINETASACWMYLACRALLVFFSVGIVRLILRRVLWLSGPLSSFALADAVGSGTMSVLSLFSSIFSYYPFSVDGLWRWFIFLIYFIPFRRWTHWETMATFSLDFHFGSLLSFEFQVLRFLFVAIFATCTTLLRSPHFGPVLFLNFWCLDFLLGSFQTVLNINWDKASFVEDWPIVKRLQRFSVVSVSVLVVIFRRFDFLHHFPGFLRQMFTNFQ